MCENVLYIAHNRTFRPCPHGHSMLLALVLITKGGFSHAGINNMCTSVFFWEGGVLVPSRLLSMGRSRVLGYKSRRHSSRLWSIEHQPPSPRFAPTLFFLIKMKAQHSSRLTLIICIALYGIHYSVLLLPCSRPLPNARAFRCNQHLLGEKRLLQGCYITQTHGAAYVM